MQEIKIEGLEGIQALADQLDSCPAVIAAAKKEAYQEAVREMKSLLDANIGGGGKVKSWQTTRTGSRQGYAAVSPQAKRYTDPTRKEGHVYAVGAVTNAIESGHKFPSPTGKNKKYADGKKKYQGRIASGRQKVPGLFFYERASQQMDAIVESAVKKVEEAAIRHLEGS
jgi:hypothetical protein